MTFEEMLLWQALKDVTKPIPLNIISQQTIYHFNLEKFYILDFLILPYGIVIEVDGNQHNSEQIEYDSKRDSFLKDLGLFVIRFDNNIVRNNLEAVTITILKAIGSRLDCKLSSRFWQWYNACKRKEKNIVSSFNYKDIDKIRKLNQITKNRKNFLKEKPEFDRNHIYNFTKKILKHMFSSLDNINL